MLPEIAMNTSCRDVSVKLYGTFRRDRRFPLPDVGIAKEHAACEVVFFYLVQIEDINLTNPEQGQILYDLIADSARADDGDFASRQCFLREPVDEAVAVIARVGHR